MACGGVYHRAGSVTALHCLLQPHLLGQRQFCRGSKACAFANLVAPTGAEHLNDGVYNGKPQFGLRVDGAWLGDVSRCHRVASVEHGHLLQDGSHAHCYGGEHLAGELIFVFFEQLFQAVLEPLPHVLFDLKLAEVGMFGAVFLPHQQVGRSNPFFMSTLSQFSSWRQAEASTLKVAVQVVQGCWQEHCVP